MIASGQLVLVATPIGNLGDLSPRAQDALRTADAIACEDTRRTSKLLSHCDIPRPRMIVVNEHTEHEQLPRLMAMLRDGATVALVSDAGMPAISDPGERLVVAAIEGGHHVTVIPGPVAAVSALVISGLDSTRFVMEGFLPRSGKPRRDRLNALVDEPRTTVFYEAPHRLLRTLTDMHGTWGSGRRVMLARELTKLHEECWRGDLAEAVAHWSAIEPRGEFVIVVAGAAAAPEATEGDVRAALVGRLDRGMDRKTAIADVAATLGVQKRVVYGLALSLAQTLHQ